MIQFNLLPDVKLEYIKATYRRRIITFFSVAIAAFFIAIFVLMFLFVRVNQTRHISSLDKDIETNLATLRENPDLDKVLTVQNQLNSLPNLHEGKNMSSRMFDYLSQITPNNVAVSNVDVEFEAKTISIKGTADELSTVNRFVDTIKFTEFAIKDVDQAKEKAFSSVVLQQFSINDTAGSDDNGAVSYEISFNFNEQIFANTATDGDPVANNVELSIPSIITTRSETQKPDRLFEEDKSQVVPENEGGSN